jgi:hypothetical protein
MRLLVAVLLVGCNSNIVIDPDLGTCTDINLDDPPASEVVGTAIPGGGAEVHRTAVFKEGSTLSFVPTIVAEGNTLSVHEAWEGESDGTDMCFVPALNMSGVFAELQVRWFLPEDDVVPYSTVVITPM